jgi:hypothetical protein
VLRRTVILLIVITGLAGCQRGPSRPLPEALTPQPAPAVSRRETVPQPRPLPEPQPQPPPEMNPGPAPVPAAPSENPLLTKVCDYKVPAAERLDALKTVVLDYAMGTIPNLDDGKHGAIPCIRWEGTEARDLLLVTGPGGQDGGTMVIAWRNQDQWHVAGAASDMFLDWAWIAHGGLVSGSPDLVLVNGNYSGHAKRLLHAGIDASGDLKITPGPGFGKSAISPLEGGLILVNARTSEWYDLFPNACEACSPLDAQVLAHWDGTQFVIEATRAVPDPVITLNRLRIALQRADQTTAASLVITPDLLDQIQPVLQPPSDDYTAYADTHAIAAIEARNWGALPPQLRSPLPESQTTFAVTRALPGGSATIHLSRQETGWVVTGLAIQGSPLLTASLADMTAALQAVATATSPGQAYSAGDEAATLLQSLLPAPEGQALGAENAKADARLPNLTFFPASGDGLRVVVLSSAPKGILFWTWIQWRDGDHSRLQALRLKWFDQVDEVKLLNGNGQRSLVVRWKMGRTESASVYRLDAISRRWVQVADAFALLPSKIGGSSVDRLPSLQSWDDGFAIHLNDSGMSLQVCGKESSGCVTAEWDGKQYLPK